MVVELEDANVLFPEDFERARLAARASQGDIAAAQELEKLNRWDQDYWDYVRDSRPKFPPVRSYGWGDLDD